MKLILASKSPRRHHLLKKLLQEIDFPVKDFEIQIPNIDESCKPNESPVESAVRLAKEKSLSVVAGENTIIITADTIVVLDGKIFGKPKDKEDAIQMLNDLSGKTHEVITGFCIINTKAQIITDHDSSQVTFRKLDKKEIEDFVDTGIPMDKAGAYAVQEDTHNFIAKIDGSYTNVMGLPTEKIATHLTK